MKEILFGAAYYDEYMPYERLEKDMQMLTRAGMNVVRIAESTWGTMEPHKGQFDFTHIDRVLLATKKHGLKVIIGTPTYALPTWMVKECPDVLAVTPEGRNRYGARQNMDITHPFYLERAEIMIRALVSHVQEFPHIIGFQLDNETKYYDTAGENIQKAFIEYLKYNFPSLDELNDTFGLNYWSNRINDWDDFPNVCGTINGSLAAEFDKFRRELVTNFLAWQAGLINEYKRPDQFLTQNFDYEWRDHSYGVQPQVDHFKAAKCLTIAGVDIYHWSQNELTGREIAFGGDISRSLLQKNYLVLETEAQGFPQWTPYEGQLRLQAFSHIASGANSVMYWHWHSIHNSFESYWKGILSHDLAENVPYREISSIGRDLKAWGSKIVNLRKKNRVAILISNESLSGMKYFPIGRTPLADDLPYNNIFRWLYDALYNINVECDFISPDTEDFSQYSLIIVPALYSAPKKLLTNLKDYVYNGGHLLATFKTGFSNEYLRIYSDSQPHILSECFGVKYDQFTLPKDVRLRSTGALSNAQVSEWMEFLQLTTATAIAYYENKHWDKYAAVTCNDYGSGSAWYLGCYFSREALEEWLPEVLKKSGVHMPQNELNFPIIVRTGINDAGNKIVYYFNYSDNEQSVRYCHGIGTELTQSFSVKTGDIITLQAWSFYIIEEET